MRYVDSKQTGLQVGVYGWKKRAKDYIKWCEVDKGGQVVVLGVGVNLYDQKSKMKETTCQ